MGYSPPQPPKKIKATEPGSYEILLRWDYGDPPVGWPGTLSTGSYCVKGCVVIDGQEYSGTSANFEWDDEQENNVELNFTLYQTGAKKGKKCKPCSVPLHR